MGVNPGNLLCTTCVRPGCKRYTVGGIWGGDLEIKNIQNKFILFVLFHVEDVKDTVYEMSCFKWYACRRRQRYTVRISMH